MSENILVAKLREQSGKGPARKLRVQGELPAVVYAKDQQTLSVSICPKETVKLFLGPLRRNVLVNLKIEGPKPANKLVMMKDRQLHPTKREPIHIDFVEVDLKKPVIVSVPVKLFGKSESVTLGGKLEHVLHKMRVSCLPNQIPQSIDIDITSIAFGSTHAEDVKLPQGLTLAEKPKVVVLTIKKPRGATKEEEKEKEKAGGKK